MKKIINKKNTFEFFAITLGIFITAASVYYLMMPSNIIIGSISGLVLVLAKFIPLPISLMTFIINGIILVIGFILIGKEFGIKTVYTTLMLPVFLAIFEVITPEVPMLTDDIILNTLAYIVAISIGQAILFNTNASSGGLDVIAKILNKYLRIEVGKALIVSGFIIAICSAFIYDRTSVVVSILGTYFQGIVLDYFISGFHIRKKVCIISEHHNEIQEFIVSTIKRGATLYPIIGGYENENKIEVVTILTRNEYQKLIKYLNELDSKAFITVNNVGEVIGNWHNNGRF